MTGTSLDKPGHVFRPSAWPPGPVDREPNSVSGHHALTVFVAEYPYMGTSGAYPRAMVARGNAAGAGNRPQRRGHAADR